MLKLTLPNTMFSVKVELYLVKHQGCPLQVEETCHVMFLIRLLMWNPLWQFMSNWHPIKDACCTWSVFLTQLVLVWKSSHLTQHKDSQLLWVKSRFKSGSGWIMCLFPSKRCQRSLSAFSFCLPLPSNSEASLQKFITLPNIFLIFFILIFLW